MARGKPGPKHRNIVERENAILQVAILHRRGYSVEEIAVKLKVTVPQVRYDINLIQKRYAERQLQERHAYVQEKLDQYAELRKEAWEAYERSKQDFRKEVTEHAPAVGKEVEVEQNEVPAGGRRKMNVVRRTVTVEDRLPAAEYLRIIGGCLDAERELQGLDPPKNVKVDQTVVNIDWSQLLSPPAGLARAPGLPAPAQQQAADDPVESLIRAVATAPPGGAGRALADYRAANPDGVIFLSGDRCKPPDAAPPSPARGPITPGAGEAANE